MARKRYVALTVLSLGGMVATTTPPAWAKEKLGTVTTPKGELKEKVRVEGLVEAVKNGKNNWVILKESNGEKYTVNLGPKSFKEAEVRVGEAIKVDGVEYTDGKVAAWKLIKSNGKEVRLRTKTGRPTWVKNFKHRWHEKWQRQSAEI